MTADSIPTVSHPCFVVTPAGAPRDQQARSLAKRPGFQSNPTRSGWPVLNRPKVAGFEVIGDINSTLNLAVRLALAILARMIPLFKLVQRFKSPSALYGVSLVALAYGLHLRKPSEVLVEDVAEAELILNAMQGRIDELQGLLVSLKISSKGASVHGSDAAAQKDPARAEEEGTESEEAAFRDLAQLHERLTELEDRQKTAPKTLENVGSTDSDHAALEALAAELRKGIDDFPNVDWLRTIEDGMSIESARKLQSLALDPRASVKQRAEALHALNLLEERLGTSLLDAPICAAALELAVQSSDIERRGIYSDLEGQTHAFLREPLRRAARDDPSPAVRDELVAALAHFLPDASVEETLRWLLANDPDASVKDEAEEALKKHAKK